MRNGEIETNHVVLCQSDEVFRKTIVLQPIIEVGYITTRPDKDIQRQRQSDNVIRKTIENDYINIRLIKVKNKSFCLLFRLTINRTLMYTTL